MKRVEDEPGGGCRTGGIGVQPVVEQKLLSRKIERSCKKRRRDGPPKTGALSKAATPDGKANPVTHSRK